MQKIIIVTGFIVAIVGVGYLVTQNHTEGPAVVTQESVSEINLETESVVAEKTGETEESVTDIVPTAGAAPGVYASYDAGAIAQSDAEHILLFFHATWCPSCKALDADIITNAGSIPAGVEIYKIDYDTATDLKRQYGITTQHSIIEITSSGEAESGVSHGLTLEAVLATL